MFERLLRYGRRRENQVRQDALDKLGRTLEAKDLLVSAANDFEPNSTIPYHLARYCARLGQTDQAKQWLGKALLAAEGMEAVEKLRKRAMEDPDLEALRKDEGTG